MNENIRDMLLSNCKEDVELAATLIGENKVSFTEKDIQWLYRNTYIQDERWSTFWNYMSEHYEEKNHSITIVCEGMTSEEAISGRYSFKSGASNDK